MIEQTARGTHSFLFLSLSFCLGRKFSLSHLFQLELKIIYAKKREEEEEYEWVILVNGHSKISDSFAPFGIQKWLITQPKG